MMLRAIIGATPELLMALLMAKAQAMVMRMSQDMYFVYFLGGKSLVHAMMMVVTQTKKNMSNFIPGTRSFIAGNSPTVAPTIMNTSSAVASRRLPRLSLGTTSLPLDTMRNTRESPQVGMNWSSAQRIRVSPSSSVILSRSPGMA